jgi:HTH-type transcriptional regulator, competence development regulator
MAQSEKTLGQKIKDARETQRFTLREVEEVTGISNAYLSQLENNKIKKPSANVLYKLSDFFKIPFDVLLNEAGIVDKVENTEGPKSMAGFALSSENLTKEEEAELAAYLKFLRFNKGNGKEHNKGH